MHTNLEIGAFYGKTNLVSSISQIIKKKKGEEKERERGLDKSKGSFRDI